MADSVIRLKELLLDKEQRELGELTERVERLSDVAGDEGRLTESVSRVLDEAIHKADSNNHPKLASAMAPVIASTVSTEIDRATPRLVEAMHPHMGYMVSQYVANAFKDLMAKINSRLESGLSAKRWGIKLKSLMTGQPESELLLASLNLMRVDELFLIRRGSGELVQHWEAVGVGTVAGEVARDGRPARDSNRDAVLSGYLTAINDFAREAFSDEGTGLQTLDLQKYHIFLRTSPTYLLAAKCSGPPSPNIEQALDQEFLTTLDTHAEALSGTDQARLSKVLQDLGDRLQSRLIEGGAPGQGGQSRAAWWLLGLIGAGLLGWIAYDKWMNWRTESTRAAATAVLNASSMRSYPIRIEVERGGGVVLLRGLAPSGDEKKLLLRNVQSAIGSGTVADAIDVLPAGVDDTALQSLRRDVRGDLRQSAQGTELAVARRAVDRARARMERIVSDLGRLDRAASDARARARLVPIAGQIVAASADLDVVARMFTAVGTVEADFVIRERIRALLNAIQRPLTALADLRGESVENEQSNDSEWQSLGSAAEGLALRVENLAAEIASGERYLQKQTISRLQGTVTEFETTVGSLRSNVAALEERLRSLSPAPSPTPQEKLERWARNHAVFFSDETAYRDAAETKRMLDELSLILKDSGTLIRIVGYTDETGSPQRNAGLSLDRARKVAADLVASGVPARQLVTVGRPGGPYLSTDRGGPDSPNRRVEFEVGFAGEPRGG